MEDGLKGKVALVTGGSEGIGRGIAEEYARCGVRVVISNRRIERGETAAAAMRKAGGEVVAVRGDVSKVSDVYAMVGETVKRFGRLDILVNNAGIYPPSSATEMTEDEWDQVIDINLKGTFFCSQAAARQMIEQGTGGRIINLTSMTAHKPTRFISHYCASKNGVIGLTKSLALEWSDHKITVNSISAGIIRTDTAEAIYGQGTQEQREQFIQLMVPLGYDGLPYDIAALCRFLASKDGAYITGTVIPVDGGYTI